MSEAVKSEGWTVSGKVRAREHGGAIEVVIDGLTTQARYYKPLVYEFFRKEWRGGRPAWGELSVGILMVPSDNLYSLVSPGGQKIAGLHRPPPSVSRTSASQHKAAAAQTVQCSID